MSVAVVTALYNGAAWIGETIASVTAQTCPPLEHWVIDDRSTDNSRDIVAAHRGVKLLTNPGKGPNPARAFAISETRAKYIAVLDQDDLWHPKHLELLTAALEKNPDAPAAFSGCQRFYTGDALHYRPETAAPTLFDPWTYFPMNAIAAPAQVLMRREALIAAGGWPVHIVGVADAFMWVRLSVSQPLLVLPALTVGYRQHEKSYSKLLRKNQTRTYFDRLIKAASEALRAREAAGSEVATHARRLGLVQLMFRWLETGDNAPSKNERKTIAAALDTELPKYDVKQVTELWSQVIYFAAPVDEKLPAIHRAWWLLQQYLGVPLAAQNLRRSLRGLIAHNFHLAAQKLGRR